jgi:thiamine pyrophosphate-dependent acetolactate synthase large subunit-like protein
VLNLGAGDPALIRQAAELLAAAERPFIYAGKGVLWAGGSQEEVALGDHLAAGMGSSLGARGVVPEDHPHYFHIFDMQASMTARNARRRGAGGRRGLWWHAGCAHGAALLSDP